MYHRKFRHITGNMDDMELESGESDLGNYAATIRTCWSVKAYSGEPLASVVRKATLSTRETERMSFQGPLPSPSVDYCTKSKTQRFLRWNKTSKWIVSMKHQDGWWYIVCALMTVLIGVIAILHFQREKSNSSFINTNGIVLPRNFAMVVHKLHTLILPFSNNNPVVDYSINVEFHV